LHYLISAFSYHLTYT